MSESRKLARRPPPVTVELGGGPPALLTPGPAPVPRTQEPAPQSAHQSSRNSPGLELDEIATSAKKVLTRVASGADNFFDAWSDFALRKDILNTATGFMIGGALTSIINSLVNDVLTPLISWAWQGGDGLDGGFLVLRRGLSNSTSYPSLEAAQVDGALTLNYGLFLSAVLNFIIMSVLIFLLFRLIRRLQRAADTVASTVKQDAAQVVTQQV